jgi:uncharacterized protein
MEQKFIGRQKEQDILRKSLQTKESEMVAVVGRRRVGKTYLIRQTYGKHIRFELTGQQNTSVKRQLVNFSFMLGEHFPEEVIANLPTPADWQQAFQQLIKCIKTLETGEKIVLFFDELPWLAQRKSGFLEGLDFFWNSWAVKRADIVVVICGSAASWMIRKVVHHKGGLHNRISRQVRLEPFTLHETELYLRSRDIHLNRYQILQIYMALGGVPHYLKEVESGKSAVKNIENICFSPGSLLADEFFKLYPSLFEHSENHVAIIGALAQKWKGLTRQEIIAETKHTDGGGLTRCLDELSTSGFITSYTAFGNRKRDAYYRLTDAFSLFYLRFMTQKMGDSWQNFSQTPMYASWAGYAFENICLKHIAQIKKALEIGGIYSETSGFYHRGTSDTSGVQIDLLIDRRDSVIDLFEIKFYKDTITLDKQEAAALRRKISAFQEVTGTKKQVFLHMLTTYGLEQNEHTLGLVQSAMTIDVLFEP